MLGLEPQDQDIRFSEVSGLSVELVTEEVPEGGENRFVQRYPVRRRYPELTLKRALVSSGALVQWVRECIDDFRITPRDLNVTLLNPEHEPLVTWRVVGAYPTKWSVSDLNASSNSIAIESIQLFYRTFSVDYA